MCAFFTCNSEVRAISKLQTGVHNGCLRNWSHFFNCSRWKRIRNFLVLNSFTEPGYCENILIFHNMYMHAELVWPQQLQFSFKHTLPVYAKPSFANQNDRPFQHRVTLVTSLVCTTPRRSKLFDKEIILTQRLRITRRLTWGGYPAQVWKGETWPQICTQANENSQERSDASQVTCPTDGPSAFTSFKGESAFILYFQHYSMPIIEANILNIVLWIE